MTEKQINHIKRLKVLFGSLMTDKYKKGAIEHGGDIFDYTELTLLDAALNENIDQFVYLMTLREKLNRKLYKR